MLWTIVLARDGGSVNIGIFGVSVNIGIFGVSVLVGLKNTVSVSVNIGIFWGIGKYRYFLGYWYR